MSKMRKSLKRKSKNIFIFIIVSGFTACGWIFEDTRISPEKPPLFRLGDTLIFESEVSIDSFYVNMARLYKVGEDDGSGKEWDNERYYSVISQINCSDSCYKFTSAIRPDEYYVTALSLGSSFNAAFKPGGIKLYDGYSGRKLKISKYTIKELFELTYPYDSLYEKNVCKFFYSKKYGLVQYQLFNNEVFQITEASLEMLMARE